MIQEAKAKFFDLQRAIEQRQAELSHLVELRVNLVKQIEALEKETCPPCDYNECCIQDADAITA